MHLKDGKMKTGKSSTLAQIIIRPKDEIQFPVIL